MVGSYCVFGLLIVLLLKFETLTSLAHLVSVASMGAILVPDPRNAGILTGLLTGIAAIALMYVYSKNIFNIIMMLL
jgi:hypothetical protein